MAVTDDERREVARRLRHAWVNVPDRDPVRHHLRVLNEIYEAVGIGDGEADAIDLFDRLADLIEPSIPADPGEAGLACVDAFIREHTEKPVDRGTPQKVAEEMFGKMRHSTKEEADAYDAMLKSKSVELHPVDREALLALADELDGEGLDGWASGPLNVGDYARRIREACGEEGA